jgi:hypothetical protein
VAADVAGFRCHQRNPVALAMLTVDEQKAFTQLLADVAALLKKADERPE